MASGNYDHPAYLVRQPIPMGRTTAGANGTSGGVSFPYAMRLRTASALVITAGTSTGAGNRIDLLVGTASVGQVALGTGAAGTIVTGATDMNVQVPAGTPVYMRNGTDAQGVASVTLDMTLDPAATWVG